MREVVAKFDKTTENFAVYKHQPSSDQDLICQVYIPRKQLNGTIPQELKVSVQQL
jgi:hypothetical protein